MIVQEKREPLLLLHHSYDTALPQQTETERRMQAHIFDMDGLLLDTERLYSACFQKIFEENQGEWKESFKTRLLGKREEEVAKVCVREGNLSISIDEFRVIARDLQHQSMSSAPLMPAEDLLQILHQNAVPMALATSSVQSVLELKTKSHQEVFKLFSAIVTGDQVQCGKPAPDIFLEAARRLDVDPLNCLVFEDSPTGVQAAIAAGMNVVWIPDPFLWPHLQNEYPELIEHRQVRVLSSLGEYLSEVAGRSLT
jgi:pseudouridine 5'-phosphatase